MQELKIKDLIHAVRQELIESENERVKKGITPLFYVENLKIEVNFVVAENVSGGGKIKMMLVEVGGDAAYKSEQVHKITLELKTLVGQEQVKVGKGAEPGAQRIKRLMEGTSQPNTKGPGQGALPGIPPGFRPGFIPK